MSIQEIYNKVMASEELKASFAEAAKSKETIEKWLKDQGSDASPEEVAKFLKEQEPVSGEINDDELENVAGGKNSGMSAFISVVGVGITCAVVAIKSEAQYDDSQKCFDNAMRVS